MRVKHVKRGSTYDVIGEGLLQSSAPVAEGASLVVYQSEHGDLWVRPREEFYDGRFTWATPDDVAELKLQIAVLQDTNEGLMSTLTNFNKLRWWEKARWKW